VSELLLSRRDLSQSCPPHCSLLHCAALPSYYPETYFLLWRIKISFSGLPQPDCWVKPLNRHLLSWTCSMLLKTTRVWGPAPQNKFTKSMTLGTLLKWWLASQISTITQNGGKQALNVTVAALYRTPLLYQFRVNAAHAEHMLLKQNVFALCIRLHHTFNWNLFLYWKTSSTHSAQHSQKCKKEKQFF